jgi:hypothetical protein
MFTPLAPARLCAAALALGVLQAATAQAAEPPERKPEPPPAELRSGKRPLPDYDARGGPPEEPGEDALWVPRVALFPLYVVSEYVLRRPLGWVTVEVERANLISELTDFFTFGPDKQAGIVPTTLIDFGFRPSVGLYFFWDGAVVRDNYFRVHAATWGLDWLRLTVTDRYQLAQDTRVGVRGVFSRRPDWVFYGLGPRSDQYDESRYSSDMLESSLFVEHEGWRSSYFRAFAGLRSATFGDDTCCDGPPITSAVARDSFAYPPGFLSGYSIAHHGFTAELDTRRPSPAPGSGVRLVAQAEQAARLDGAEPQEWVHYGGGLGGYWDVSDHNRVVGLSVNARFVDPIRSDAEIPFTEQVRLGGAEPLRGFLDGRLIGRSSLTARLDYQWPIWTFLDGSLHGEAGNVFGEHLEGFEAEAMRLSFGLGIRASGRRDHPFELLVATATEPIDEGAELTSFRFVFGATNGF